MSRIDSELRALADGLEDAYAGAAADEFGRLPYEEKQAFLERLLRAILESTELEIKMAEAVIAAEVARLPADKRAQAVAWWRERLAGTGIRLPEAGDEPE